MILDVVMFDSPCRFQFTYQIEIHLNLFFLDGIIGYYENLVLLLLFFRGDFKGNYFLVHFYLFCLIEFGLVLLEALLVLMPKKKKVCQYLQQFFFITQ